LDPSTFEYLKPTEAQLEQMARARVLCGNLAVELNLLLPEGADKTYILRKLREVAMWANIAITREADGSPRM
jgi:hypothetical protein